MQTYLDRHMTESSCPLNTVYHSNLAKQAELELAKMPKKKPLKADQVTAEEGKILSHKRRLPAEKNLIQRTLFDIPFKENNSSSKFV